MTLGLLAVVVFAGVSLQSNRKNNALVSQVTTTSLKEITAVTVGSNIYTVEVARSVEDQARGLSNRDSMPVNHGMLFPFPPSSQPNFWMKDMRFSLDIIWISNNKIVDISRHLPIPAPGTPPEKLPTYTPSQGIDNVLELNAGQADQFQVGQSVKISTSQSL